MKEFFEVFFKSSWIILFVACLWLIHFANVYFDLNLNKLGIVPRNLSGIVGVFFAPLIHSKDNLNHLLNNSAPLLILTWTLFYFYKPIAWKIFIYSWLCTGVFVWISARVAYHIGVSGILYSLLFFIFFSGVFRKDARLLTVALMVVFLYGSMVWGIFPYNWKISFESHFFGAITGTVLAYFYKKRGASFKIPKTQWEVEEELGIEPPDFESTWKED
tara:strand:+ start:13906 stop:14556 length:651 start_codon:yes stop_codon:yes gene_type:complete